VIARRRDHGDGVVKLLDRDRERRRRPVLLRVATKRQVDHRRVRPGQPQCHGGVVAHPGRIENPDLADAQRRRDPHDDVGDEGPVTALAGEVALRRQGVLDIGAGVVDAVGEPRVQALDGQVIAGVQHRDPGGPGLGIGVALLSERLGVTRLSVWPAVVIGLSGQDVVGSDVRHRVTVLMPPQPQHQLGDVHPGGYQERGNRQVGLGERGGQLLIGPGVLPA
jgi:hypothetical protein